MEEEERGGGGGAGAGGRRKQKSDECDGCWEGGGERGAGIEEFHGRCLIVAEGH